MESKSVHGRVRVNEQGEWVRVFGGREQGMPSPIEQARRQSTFLSHFLDDHAPQLAGKLLGLIQAHFGALSIDVVVAISDTGIIDRPKKLSLPEVCKADQAHAKIEEILAKQRRDTGLLTQTISLKSGRDLSRSELANILALLPAQHRPRVAHPAPAPVSVAPLSPAAEPVPAQTEQVVMVTAPSTPGELCCETCGKLLSPKVAQYCRDNAERFGDKLLCFDHQRAGRGRGQTGGKTTSAPNRP